MRATDKEICEWAEVVCEGCYQDQFAECPVIQILEHGCTVDAERLVPVDDETGELTHVCRMYVPDAPEGRGA